MTSIAWLAGEYRKDRRMRLSDAKFEERRRRCEERVERRVEEEWLAERERLMGIGSWIHVHWWTSKRSNERDWVWMRESDLKDARRRRNRRSGKSEAKRRDWSAGQVVQSTYDMKTKTTRLQGDRCVMYKGIAALGALAVGALAVALVVAASGAMGYEGIAGNDAHRDWLDSIVDRCVMYKAGHDEGYAEQLGGDEGFVEKASKYFGGTMMEARRFLGAVAEDGDDEEEEDEAAESSDSD